GGAAPRRIGDGSGGLEGHLARAHVRGQSVARSGRSEHPRASSPGALRRQGDSVSRRSDPPQGGQGRQSQGQVVMGATLTGRERRKLRIRRKISGTGERPRLTVFRSASHIYAQVVNDV